MDERARMEERLYAYILPNEPKTPEQQSAFDEAVDAQLAFERQGDERLPPGVESLTIGSYSLRASASAGAADSGASLCPAAWALLRNAGLLRRTLPVAQRL